MVTASEESVETVLGKVTSVFGIQGWIKIHSYTQPRENIFQYPEWRLGAGQAVQAYRLAKGRWHGKALLAKLESIEDRDRASQLCGSEIRIATADLPPLDEGEYYWYQLEGLRVVTTDDSDLGVVDHLLETGANDVLVVTPDAVSLDNRQRLIPFLPDDSIREIRLEAGVMVVDWDPEF